MEGSNELNAELAKMAAFLRVELGYDAEDVGNVHRHMQEIIQMTRAIDGTLRGHGDELGIVAWVMVLRRSWITLVALLGAAFGYFLNDVVDTLGRERRLASSDVGELHPDSLSLSALPTGADH